MAHHAVVGEPPKNADKTAGSRWFRLNLCLHRWASLIATLPFLILCLSGTLLIFSEEIDMALGILPSASQVQQEEMRPLNEAVENTLETYPEEKVSIIGIDPVDHPGLLLIGTVPKGDTDFKRLTRRFAYLASGELTAKRAAQSLSLTEFIFKLHAQWFLGHPGAIVGALIALLVVISLLSGLVVYGPFVRKVVFGAFRRGNQRILQLDLHNFIGSLVLGWALIVSLTGLFLGAGGVVTGLWAQNQLKQIQAANEGAVVDVRRPPVNVDAISEAALAVAPEGWAVEVIIWPGTAFTTAHNYAVRIKGSGLDDKLFRIVLVDAIDGKVIKTVELPWYMKIIVLSQPLHFGDYGGLPLKLLWTACTWLTLFITANGAWLWWARRRSRRLRANENLAAGEAL